MLPSVSAWKIGERYPIRHPKLKHGFSDNRWSAGKCFSFHHLNETYSGFFGFHFQPFSALGMKAHWTPYEGYHPRKNKWIGNPCFLGGPHGHRWMFSITQQKAASATRMDRNSFRKNCSTNYGFWGSVQWSSWIFASDRYIILGSFVDRFPYFYVGWLPSKVGHYGCSYTHGVSVGWSTTYKLAFGNEWLKPGIILFLKLIVIGPLINRPVIINGTGQPTVFKSYY